jgi:hypothetical protein
MLEMNLDRLFILQQITGTSHNSMEARYFSLSTYVLILCIGNTISLSRLSLFAPSLFN